MYISHKIFPKSPARINTKNSNMFHVTKMILNIIACSKCAR